MVTKLLVAAGMLVALAGTVYAICPLCP